MFTEQEERQLKALVVDPLVNALSGKQLAKDATVQSLISISSSIEKIARALETILGEDIFKTNLLANEAPVRSHKKTV